MTSDDRAGDRIIGSLRTVDGVGIVRIEDRLDASIDDVWAALTDPARLAHWLGELEGDLRLGGEYRARFHASGWEGTCRVEVCEPLRRLVVVDVASEKAGLQVTEVTLTADGDQTALVFEQRGTPLEYLAAYGAGDQIHVEDLAAYLSGRERCDADARWAELEPAYKELPVSAS